MKKFRNKQHGDLTLDEAAMLSRMFPHEPVVFRNKIERMRNLVTVNEGGLLGNLEGTLLLMNEPTFNMYAASLYAMDKYGNLFVDQLGGQRDYVANSSRRVFELKQTSTINHSSFMAGADVLCAGCIHIGYDTRAARLEAGVLSFIDNNSGHYKPTAQNLQNCVIALRDQGVHMDDVMVCDRSQGKSRALSYWAPDFIAGMRNPWPQPDEPPMGSPLPPPIRM